VLLHRLRSLLGEHCTINLKPVIDLPAGHTPIDSYEIPARLREQLQLRYPSDVFPYAAAVSRRIDLDHTIPYLRPDRGGPPGQTRIGNLGPHTRHHHRLKTFGGWQVRQPEPGTWLWRSPHHRIYLVNPSGAHPLGNTEFAEAICARPAHPTCSRPDPTRNSHSCKVQGLDWLPGYVRDEVEVLVHVEQCRASEFRTGGDQEICHGGRPVKPSLGEQSLHGHRT